MEREKYYYKVASPKYIRQANEFFNQELAKQIFGRQQTGYVYQLGYPGEILQAAGFPDNKIELSANHLKQKSEDIKHPFPISDIQDLVTAINNPVAVFEYGASTKAQNVIIEKEYQGKRYMIGVHFNQYHDTILVNSIRGLFPKDTHEILNWVQQGKLDYVNKEKFQTLIDKQQINPADVPYLDLDFVAKVVKNFENPKFSMKNVMIIDNYFEETKFHYGENDVKATNERSENKKTFTENSNQHNLLVKTYKETYHLDLTLKGKEFILEEDLRDSTLKSEPLIFRKGTKLTVTGVFWMYGYKIQDASGNYCWLWKIPELEKEINLLTTKQAIIERLEQPTLHGRLTDKQLDIILGYRNLFPEKSEKEVFDALLKDMQNEFDKNMIGEAGIDDLREELKEISKGVRRNEGEGQGRKI